MCQEFNLSCTLRLWDTLLAAEGPEPSAIDEAFGFDDEFESVDLPPPETRINRFTFIDFIAVALVKNIRMTIFDSDGDFAECMEAL